LNISRELELTSINVVNVEDSPITKVGESIIGLEEQSSKDRNIGLYMKSGYCCCDIKNFVPSIVCMALVALWFSDNKTKKTDSKFINRKYLIFHF
jgi:hypothetical protein